MLPRSQPQVQRQQEELTKT